MAEEFVCEQCAYTALEDGDCPFCGAILIKIDGDLDFSDDDDERYPKNVQLLEDDDDDFDLVETKPKRAKKKQLGDELAAV